MSCNHDCANCTSKNSEGCFLIEPHKNSTIKKRIGIVSGKGGVGKSLVTSLLACAMQKEGLIKFDKNRFEIISINL